MTPFEPSPQPIALDPQDPNNVRGFGINLPNGGAVGAFPLVKDPQGAGLRIELCCPRITDDDDSTRFEHKVLEHDILTVFKLSLYASYALYTVLGEMLQDIERTPKP